MDQDPDTVVEYLDEEEAPPPPKGPFARYWDRVGGGSFTVSVLVHAIFVVIAFLIIWRTQTYMEPENIDFLSGGGGGTEGNTKIHEKKHRMMVNKPPAMKLSSAAPSSVSIPNTQSSLNISTVSITSGMMSGTPGTGGGFGGGRGKGHGTGMGAGFGPGSGPGFTAKFLGMVAAGTNIIFCIDTSGSMIGNLKPEGIATLRREFKTVITSLPPAFTFNVICFGHNGDIFKPKSVPATTENKNDVLRFFEGYYGGGSADFGRTRTEKYGRAGKDALGIEYIPLETADVKELAGTEGGSRIDLAMVAAFERKPTTLYVLSDGAPGTKKAGEDKEMDKDDLIKFIHEKFQAIMGTAKMAVNTIWIESDTDEGKEGNKFLRKLARKFDGKHKEVKLTRAAKGGKPADDKEKEKEKEKDKDKEKEKEKK